MADIPKEDNLPNNSSALPGSKKNAVLPSLRQLRQEFAELSASAVDPLEIAAALEVDGFSDQIVKARYGFADVFMLAEKLYQETKPNPAEPVSSSAAPKILTRSVLHGLLFCLPALCYPIAVPLLADSSALVLLIIAMVMSWAASQGIAFLAYARRGRGDIIGSQRALLAGMAIAAVILNGVLTSVGWLLGAPIPTLLFAAGQGIYLLAASALLVNEAALWLLIALAPGALVAGAQLLAGQPAALRPAVWAALGCSLLLVIVFAVLYALPRGNSSHFAQHGLTRWSVRLTEIRAAIPHAAIGALAASLLMFNLADTRINHGALVVAAIMACLPLSLSMGAAEWILNWYRSRIRQLLQGIWFISDFRAQSRRVLALALARYALVVGLLMALAAGLVDIVDGAPQWSDTISYGGYLAIGCTLFLVILLQVFGATGLAITWCSIGLGAEVLLALIVPAAQVQLIVGMALFCALATNAGIILTQATRYR